MSTCSSVLISFCLARLSLSLFLFESRPTPEISWAKVSGELPTKRTSFLHYDKTLRIVDVSESDAGEYRCTARNPLGSVHQTIRVTVKGVCVMQRGASRRAPSHDGFMHTVRSVINSAALGSIFSCSILDQRCPQEPCPGSRREQRADLQGQRDAQALRVLGHERHPHRE